MNSTNARPRTGRLLPLLAAVLLTASLLVALVQTSAHATTATVTNVSELLDAIADGDVTEIVLLAGTYELDDEIIVDRSLIMRGHQDESREDVIVQPSAAGLTAEIWFIEVEVGTFVLQNLTVAGFLGGGVWLEGEAAIDATFTNVVFRDNSSYDYGGAIYAFAFDSITITGSLFQGNSAEYGGALYLECGGCETEAERIDIQNSTFTGNSATEGGGAIYLWGWGSFSLTGSTLSGNSAEYASAIYLDDWEGNQTYPDSPDHVSIMNSTISGNTSSEGGGALYLEAGLGDVSIVHATIANNVGGGILVEGSLNGIAAAQVNGGVWLTGSIVAANGDYDCYGPILSGGSNIDGDGSCNLDSDLGDQPETDPQLAPLASNGGPTQTHAIGEASPAFGAADSDTCPATDQRGVTRKAGGCDVGAFEFVPAAVDDDGDDGDDGDDDDDSGVGDVVDDEDDEADPAEPIEAEPDFTG